MVAELPLAGGTDTVLAQVNDAVAVRLHLLVLDAKRVATGHGLLPVTNPFGALRLERGGGLLEQRRFPGDLAGEPVEQTGD
jgi:hypothetical protein